MQEETNRELLELAANASGLHGFIFYPPNKNNKSIWWGMEKYYADGDVQWNPLTDDADAFRLAVQLRMHLNIYYTDTRVTADDVFLCEMHNAAPSAATRRAIVRAAAEVGRNIK